MAWQLEWLTPAKYWSQADIEFASMAVQYLMLFNMNLPHHLLNFNDKIW